MGGLRTVSFSFLLLTPWKTQQVELDKGLIIGWLWLSLNLTNHLLALCSSTMTSPRSCWSSRTSAVTSSSPARQNGMNCWSMWWWCRLNNDASVVMNICNNHCIVLLVKYHWLYFYVIGDLCELEVTMMSNWCWGCLGDQWLTFLLLWLPTQGFAAEHRQGAQCPILLCPRLPD